MWDFYLSVSARSSCRGGRVGGRGVLDDGKQKKVQLPGLTFRGGAIKTSRVSFECLVSLMGGRRRYEPLCQFHEPLQFRLICVPSDGASDLC